MTVTQPAPAAQPAPDLDTDVIRKHVRMMDGAGGPTARIVGSRIRVMDIAIWHEKLGMTPAEIVRDYDTVTLADVHAALAYYWDNRDAIEQKIADDEAFYDEMRRTQASKLRDKTILPACV